MLSGSEGYAAIRLCIDLHSNVWWLGLVLSLEHTMPKQSFIAGPILQIDSFGLIVVVFFFYYYYYIFMNREAFDCSNY